MKSFQNRAALITGGNSGIGKATACLFPKNGAKVAVAARRVKEGKAVVKQISGAAGRGGPGGCIQKT